jgi:hypothetical protein
MTDDERRPRSTPEIARVGRSLRRDGQRQVVEYVFAVAAHRCEEVFPLHKSVTLWRLSASIEEEFDARWEQWLDTAAEWTSFFERVAAVQAGDLAQCLREFEVVNDHDLAGFAKLRRSAEGRSVALPGEFAGSAADAALLALGFSRGETGSLAVPHMSAQ